jgi:hypothetical protein
MPNHARVLVIDDPNQAIFSAQGSLTANATVLEAAQRTSFAGSVAAKWFLNKLDASATEAFKEVVRQVVKWLWPALLPMFPELLNAVRHWLEAHRG